MFMDIFNEIISINRRLKSSRFDLRLILILCIYLILGVILFRYYQFQINNDGIGYISTAKLYLTGNIYNAISDYWGPLLSWLLLPFMFFAKTPVAALESTKILSLILGFFTIIGIRQLSYRFEMDEIVRTVVLLIMVPVVLYFAMSVISPDLLMVCILVYFLAIIYDVNYPDKLTNAILCGILGALAYFTKSYGLTFFISIFLVLSIFHYLRDSDRNRRNKVLKNFLLGITVFLMISSVWVGLISFKDEKLTIGTAAEFNHALVGPESHGFPDYYQGIHKPGQVNQNYTIKPWSPFSSWHNFKYQLNLIWDNTIKMGNILNSFSYLSLLIISAFIILLLIQPRRKLLKQNAIIYPLLTIILLAGGYVMILVEERYIWLIYVLLILMGGYLINLIFKTGFFTNKYVRLKKIGILVLFAFLFITMPVNYLFQNAHTGENIYNLSNTLNGYGVHGNVATNDNIEEMNYLAYYMNITSYGQSPNTLSNIELQNELKNNHIDYYFVWNNNNSSFNLQGYHDVTLGNIMNLNVYSLIR
jgi:hypothetical protein